MSAYRPIGRWSPGLLRSGALFDGGDHLLHVTSSHVQHSYQRFPYAEIRALTLTSQPLWTTARIAWLVSSALFLFFATLSGSPALRIVLALLPACALAFGVWSLLQGPRCHVRLISLSGDWPLLAVSTLRAANETLPVIRAQVQAAQSNLPVPDGLPALTPAPEQTPYQHPANLWYALSGTLLVGALLLIAYTRIEAVRTPLLTLAVLLFPTLLLIAAALWNRTRRFQAVAAAVLVATVVDGLITLIAVLIDSRLPTFLFSTAQLILQFKNNQPLLLAAAVAWRLFAAALTAWIARQNQEQP